MGNRDLILLEQPMAGVAAEHAERIVDAAVNAAARGSAGAVDHISSQVEPAQQTRRRQEVVIRGQRWAVRGILDEENWKFGT